MKMLQKSSMDRRVMLILNSEKYTEKWNIFLSISNNDTQFQFIDNKVNKLCSSF